MRRQIKILNTILYCQHWPEAVAFYRDGLGFAITVETDWFVEFELNPGARLSVADEARTTIKSAEGRGLTLTFQVAQADRIWQRLAGRGLEVGPVRDHPWGGRAFFLFDPEGNRLEVWSS
ncbi:MAG: VOC family protein [Anaerolineae bacterium]